MTVTCSWCRKPTTTPVNVGIIAGDSGPGGTVHACPGCQAAHRILSLDQHPTDTDGRPRYEPRPTPRNHP